METFGIEELAARFGLFSMTMRQFSRWVVQSKLALSERVIQKLKAEMEGREKEKFVSMFAITSPPHLGETETEQI